MKCSNCQSELEADAKFCGECGQPVQAAAPEEEPTSQDLPRVRATVIEEAPTMQAERLELVVQRGREAGRRHAVELTTRIGRSNDNDIVVFDSQCSRFHAQIELLDSGYVLSDQGSTNGTFLNGQRLSQPARLQAGDVITIGETSYQVVRKGAQVQTPAAPTLMGSAPVGGGPPPRREQAPPPAHSAPAPPQPQQARAEAAGGRRSLRTILIVAAVIVSCLCVLSAGFYFGSMLLESL